MERLGDLLFSCFVQKKFQLDLGKHGGAGWLRFW